jgi:hypothetical protein
MGTFNFMTVTVLNDKSLKFFQFIQIIIYVTFHIINCKIMTVVFQREMNYLVIFACFSGLVVARGW